MKKFLVCLVFAFSTLALKAFAAPAGPEEIVSQGFHRMGVAFDAKVLLRQNPGFLNLNNRSKIELGLQEGVSNVSPYSPEGPRGAPRLLLADDIFYETLLLPDPWGSDRLYPLIIKQLRYPSDFSYVVLEVDPRARFGDGSIVSTVDIANSIQLMVEKAWMGKSVWQRKVERLEVSPSEVRVKFKVSGQQARDAIAFIAKAKVVRPNPNRPFGFETTGPYQITQSTSQKVTFEYSQSYWGADLPQRAGLFNFNTIEASSETIAGGSGVQESQAGYKLPSGFARTIENNRTTGKPLRTFSFNLQKESMRDSRLREALTIMFDFGRINTQLYRGSLKRPDSLLYESAFAPAGEPSAAVKERLNQCGGAMPAQSTLDFSTMGNSLESLYPSPSARRNKALAVLARAGYAMRGTQLLGGGESDQANDFDVVLKILVQTQEEEDIARAYALDLSTIGLRLEITREADPKLYLEAVKSSEFDLYAGRESMLSQEGWPAPVRQLSRVEKTEIPCYKTLLHKMLADESNSESFRITAEALARVHQALYLDIFIGENRSVAFDYDTQIVVPFGLSFSKAYLYGARPIIID